MTWSNDEIANPMGYEYCVLFDCARSALKAYPHAISLPGNICRSVYKARPDAMLEEVNQETGLALYSPTHLYGYQSLAQKYFALSLDPLMTGWVRQLHTESAIVSFGYKKMLSIGYGGAFLTNDLSLAEEMENHSHWNEYYTQHLLTTLDNFHDHIQQRWEQIYLWDRYLGDSLIRIPQEQVMPWRVMRRAANAAERCRIVTSLREHGFDVGTNYPPLEGSNKWGDTVLNFFCSPSREGDEIKQICEIVTEAIFHEGHTYG